MKHIADPDFWAHYSSLPAEKKSLAARNFKMLRDNSRHPSLHFKRVVGEYWSVRIGLDYRALGKSAKDGGIVWFWIGPHSDYDQLLRRLPD